MTFLLRWSEVPVNVETLPLLLNAEIEYLGEPPALTIVDILADLIHEDSPEAYSTAANALHITARKFHTTLLATHHTNTNNGSIHPTLNDDRYKAMARRAEIVLGLSRPDEWTLDIEVLKNRDGEKGQRRSLKFQPERGLVG